MRQIEAHAPATGKTCDRIIFTPHSKTQTMHQPGSTGMGRIAIDGNQPLMQFCQSDAVAVALFLGNLLLHTHQFSVTLHHKINSSPRQCRGFLFNMSNGGALIYAEAARILFQASLYQFKQRGLTAAISAGDADPVPGMNNHANIREQQFMATPQRNGIKIEHKICLLNPVYRCCAASSAVVEIPHPTWRYLNFHAH